MTGDSTDSDSNQDSHVTNDEISSENTNDSNNNKSEEKITDRKEPKMTPGRPRNSRVVPVRPVHRSVINSLPNPESVRQSVISSNTVPHTVQTTQHQLQTSVANVTMNDRTNRTTNMQQYIYPDDVSRNATQVGDMTGFHGHDFMNSLEKTFFNPNVTAAATTEYLGSPWIPDTQSLTVLNNVNYDQTTTNGNMEFGYHRTADYGFNYGNEMSMTNNSLHPYDIQNPLNHRTDIPYNQQGKDVDYGNYSNSISRYNTLYYDNMRTNMPGMNAEVLNYGMAPNTAAPMDIDGMLAHEAQMTRLGIGTV